VSIHRHRETNPASYASEVAAVCPSLCLYGKPENLIADELPDKAREPLMREDTL
jgi:hypothetical protein